MSKSLAIEYAKNINVNCISPGFIKTAMTDKIDEKFKEVIISKIPAARLEHKICKCSKFFSLRSIRLY